MVLNNVTKFHKIPIISIQLREQTSLDRRTYGRTGVTLNARPLSWRGHKNEYEIVVPLFGAAFAAQNKGTTILY